MPVTGLRISQVSEALRDGSGVCEIGATPVVRTIGGLPKADWSQSSVEGLMLPRGTTAQRPATDRPLVRHNQDTGLPEIYLPQTEVWVPLQGRHSYKNIVSSYIEDDFLGSVFSGSMGWTGTTSGTGSAAGLDTAWPTTGMNFVGTARLYTGTTSTGHARMQLGRTYLPRVNVSGVASTFIMFGMFGRINIPVLSTAAQRFSVKFGLTENVFPIVSTNDRLMLTYADNSNSGRWLAENYTSALSSADTGVAATTDIHTLGVVYVSDYTTGSLVETVHYYVDSDSPVASITTQIPFGTLLRPCVFMQKSVGTTAHAAYIDYVATETVGSRD